MSESLSALPGASFKGLVAVEVAGLRGMITLRGDLGAAKLKAAVKSVAGVDVPEARRTALAGETGAVWMSPDELLILGPYAEADIMTAKLAEALDGVHHLAVDVSDARALFRMTGPDWREVLSKLTPADLHPDAFGPEEIRRTRLAQVAAAFWMADEDTVQIVCFRSVAKYVFDLLSNAADSPAPVGHY